LRKSGEFFRTEKRAEALQKMGGIEAKLSALPGRETGIAAFFRRAGA
jgi:hypothetical protein